MDFKAEKNIYTLVCVACIHQSGTDNPKKAQKHWRKCTLFKYRSNEMVLCPSVSPLFSLSLTFLSLGWSKTNVIYTHNHKKTYIKHTDFFFNLKQLFLCFLFFLFFYPIYFSSLSEETNKKHPENQRDANWEKLTVMRGMVVKTTTLIVPRRSQLEETICVCVCVCVSWGSKAVK